MPQLSDTNDEALHARVRRTYRRRWWVPVGVVCVLLFTAGETFVITEAVTAPIQTKVNTSAVAIAVIQALEQSTNLSNQQTAAAQRQQSAIFNSVLVRFFAMQRYLCEASVAHSKTLGGPPAPPGICDVTLPTPAP